MPKLDRDLGSSLSTSSPKSSQSGGLSICCCRTITNRKTCLDELIGTPWTAYADQRPNPQNKRQLDSNATPDQGGRSSAEIQSSYIAATPSAPMESIFQKWSSCFQGRGSPCSLSTGNLWGRRESAEISTSNEKKKIKSNSGDVASMSCKASPNQKPLRETASEAAQQMPIMLVCNASEPREDNKFNWADKYRPTALSEFICYQEEAQMLRLLVWSGLSSHCIFEGPPGVGKRTMALALLREDFGPHELETRQELKEFKLEGGPVSSIQINVQVSSKHIEVNLLELKGFAEEVIAELIKETHTLLNHDNKTQKRAIILYGAGKLSMNAQLRIRSCLETYTGHCKVYFCASGTSMLQHLKSLCTVIQILPPSKEKIIAVLEFIAKCEAIELPPRLADGIAEKSNHSIQQAIRSFQATWQMKYPFTEDQVIMTGWEEELANIAKNVVDKQSPKQLYIIREKLKNFMVHNVSPEIIHKILVEELNKLLNYQFQLIITNLCEDLCQDEDFISQDLRSIKNKVADESNDEPVKNNAVLFLKIEESIAKFMSIYKIISQQKGEKRDDNGRGLANIQYR